MKLSKIPAPDGPAIVGRTLPTSPVKAGKGNHGKLAAFTQLYINFEHEKRWDYLTWIGADEMLPPYQMYEEVLHDGAEAEGNLGRDWCGSTGHTRFC